MELALFQPFHLYGDLRPVLTNDGYLRSMVGILGCQPRRLLCDPRE